MSASVCTRQGKALVSRQFVEMNRLRVEGLLAAFPKLMGQHAKQHTYVETDSVRYVYQPLEKNQIYLLLITTKASNIVEDLGTLRLLAKVVPDVAGGLQEHAIQEAAFDLIFAFDEVLTAGGYKEEAVTLGSIRTNLIMDSHEEKIAMALQESKEEEARKRMREQANKIREQKIKQGQQALFQGGGGEGFSAGGMEGFGGGGYQQQQQADPFNNYQQQGDPYGNPYAQMQSQAQAAPEKPTVIAKKGMVLNPKAGAGKSNSLMAAMAAEDNLFGGGAALAGGGGAAAALLGAAPAKAAAPPPSTPLTLLMEEKVSVSMTREGAVESAEVKGTLTLTANTDAGTAALVAVNKTTLPAQFNYATHPKVDKKAYEAGGVLQLKGGKSFPVNRPIGILRWSYAGDDVAPLTINCWPEDEGTGSVNVNIEMELTNPAVVLQDVNIVMPLGTTDPPVMESVDGQYKHDPAAGLLCWHFDQVDANTNATASLEFSIAGSDPEVFFPVQVGFRSETLLCPVTVTSVTHSENGTSIPHQLVHQFSPETYQCA